MIIFIGKKFLIMKLVKFKDLINRFDCFLFDQWGVIHDGKKKFSFIDKTLKKLLSFPENSPEPLPYYSLHYSLFWA